MSARSGVKTCGSQLAAEIFALRVVHGEEGLAHIGCAVAEHRHGFLDGNGVHVGEKRVDEGAFCPSMD